MAANRTFLIVGMIAALTALVCGFLVAHQQPARQISAIKAHTANSVFTSTLTDDKGKTQALSQWQGKTLVINFWATWCPPCLEEMPALSRLQEKHAANGVQFIGIALDSAEALRDFAERHPATYPFLLGGTTGADLARQLGNSRLALPYTAILDRSGGFRSATSGAISEQELDSLLRLEGPH